MKKSNYSTFISSTISWAIFLCLWVMIPITKRIPNPNPMKIPENNGYEGAPEIPFAVGVIEGVWATLVRIDRSIASSPQSQYDTVINSGSSLAVKSVHSSQSTEFGLVVHTLSETDPSPNESVISQSIWRIDPIGFSFEIKVASRAFEYYTIPNNGNNDF